MTAFEMIEMPLKTPERTIYSRSEIRIPGFSLFGHFLVPNALEPVMLHYHKHVLEFTVAVKGSLTWAANGSNYTFSGGDVFVAYPGEPHNGNQNPFSISEIYWFQLNPAVTKPFLFLCPQAAEHLTSQLKNMNKHLIHADCNIIYPLLRQIFALLENDGDRYMAASYMQLLVQHLLAADSSDHSIVTPDIDRAIQYITDNITADFTLEELAGISNLSLSHFQQKFKKQAGVGPRHFINQKKIEYSKKLLLEGKSVTDTAMLLGFNTSGYFSTVFKKYAFYTPSEFLELARNKTDSPSNK